jgi:filamentous hemagglutinin family protein
MNLKQITSYLTLFFITITPTLLQADISTDGSVGAAKTLTGPDYTIPETLGTLKGDNLFHSFDKFNIKTQESATFTGSDSIKNVISRVTGGEKSEIDGTLRSNVGKADFYFINPSGVIFGQDAKVDVPAAFHVSTADELKFQDGASFKASKNEQSTLTQAAPESFGFLETQSASIEVNGSTLEFKPESKVSLTSGKDITIKGTETKQASLTSYGGEIELKTKGDLLMENATVATTGNGGGKISVKAGNAKIQNNATIVVNNIGDIDSDEGIEFDIDSNLELLNDSLIGTFTFSEGNAGNVVVNAGELTINNASNIGSIAWSKGDAGNVSINADELRMDGHGKVSATTGVLLTGIASFADPLGISGVIANYLPPDPYSEAKPGKVEITVTGLIQLINSAGITSFTSSKGDSNNVIVNAGKLIVNSASQITSFTWSKGDAGNVIVNAGELTMDGQGMYYATGMPRTVISSLADPDGSIVMGLESHFYPDSKAKVGKVEITVTGMIQLINGAVISSTSLSKGDSGNLTVSAGELIMGGNGTLITSSTLSEGNAGNLIINVDELTIGNGAVISSATLSEGNAGDITINADELTIDGQGSHLSTGITSIATPNSKGNAGKIQITVSGLMHIINAGVSTSTLSKGDAGNMIINVSCLVLDSSNLQSASSSESSGYSTIYIPNALPSPITGYVGNVAINADSITLLNSSQISIASLQTMSQDKLSNLENMPEEVKPTINLNTRQLNIESESQITSASTKNVPASNIKINADSIYLHDGQITTSVFGTNGDGGNISINENAESDGFLVMQNGLIQANTSAEGAKGGRIRINADNLIADKSMPFQIGGEPETFSLDDKKNIIQAADPSKNPQDIESPTVPVDLGSSLISSGNTIFEPVTMAENYCRLIGTNRASSLTLEPREWFVPAASASSSIYFDGYRLDELLKYDKK